MSESYGVDLVRNLCASLHTEQDSMPLHASEDAAPGVQINIRSFNLPNGHGALRLFGTAYPFTVAGPKLERVARQPPKE